MNAASRPLVERTPSASIDSSDALDEDLVEVDAVEVGDDVDLLLVQLDGGVLVGAQVAGGERVVALPGERAEAAPTLAASRRQQVRESAREGGRRDVDAVPAVERVLVAAVPRVAAHVPPSAHRALWPAEDDRRRALRC